MIGCYSTGVQLEMLSLKTSQILASTLVYREMSLEMTPSKCMLIEQVKMDFKKSVSWSVPSLKVGKEP